MRDFNIHYVANSEHFENVFSVMEVVAKDLVTGEPEDDYSKFMEAFEDSGMTIELEQHPFVSHLRVYPMGGDKEANGLFIVYR